MQPRHLVLAGLLALAGCAAARPSRDLPTVAPEAPPLVSRFAGDAPDTVEVILRDRKPVEQAELVAPDGQVLEAARISRERIRVAADGQPLIGLEASGGSSELDSLGVTLPLFGIPRPAPDPIWVSEAHIHVADMAAYRADWPRWIVRLTLGRPEATRHKVEFPAPRPPGE